MGVRHGGEKMGFDGRDKLLYYLSCWAGGGGGGGARFISRAVEVEWR